MLDKPSKPRQNQGVRTGNPPSIWPEQDELFAQSILDSLDINMALLDAEGNIQAVNEVWQQSAIANSSPEQAAYTGKGMNYLEICRKTRGKEADEAMQAAMGIEAVLQGLRPAFLMEYGCASPDYLRWYQMRVTPLPQGKGAVVAHIDITARKELEHQKDLFFSMASHELQTPLTALKGFIQLEKRQRALSGLEKTSRHLESMERQVDRLSKVVRELLDVAKMDVGKFDYVDDIVDLETILSEVVEMLQESSPQHQLLVHGTTNGAQIQGDPDKLAQVFLNILNNAIKYSPQANQVDIFLERSDQKVQISIRDYGIGIPADAQAALFERYARVDAAKHRFIPGMGIGLYIVRQIVNHHGGEIAVESVEGQGSTFVITLPLSQ